MALAAIDTKCIADISENIMYDLHLASTDGTSVYAYAVRLTNNGRSGFQYGSFTRNKIYSITNTNTFSSPHIFGIYAVDGNWNVENNQITINNGNNTTPGNVFGIWNTNTDTSRKNFYYNTIYLGGNTTPGAIIRAYCMLTDGNNRNITKIKNNIFYNEKAPGYRNNSAFVVSPINTQGFDSSSSNYNLYVVRDTLSTLHSVVTEPKTLQQWRNLTKGDKQSYATTSTILPSSQFFKDLPNGDLNINNLSDRCWFVNGRGLPIPNLAADYDSLNVRSTAIVNGPTDIGADEFTTTTIPPPMRIQGNHAPGGTEIFVDNGKVAATIQWGSTGSLPTLGDCRWYSGVWPNDPTNNNTMPDAQLMSSYLDLPAAGGANYSYTLTLYYDSAMLGKITNEAAMVMIKRQTAVPGSWTLIAPTQVNTVARTLTINNQTGFSEFTASSAPVSPVIYTFTGNGSWDNPLNWQNGAVPPQVITGNTEIIISPADGGECVLNRLLTLPSGAKLTIKSGANFKVIE
jgi:hypothetical protein